MLLLRRASDLADDSDWIGHGPNETPREEFAELSQERIRPDG